jgi:hypothetical protein
VYGEGYLIDRHGNRTRPFPTEPFSLQRLVNCWSCIPQPTVFFRKRVFAEVGYLDEDLHHMMDWDILIRIAKRYDLAYLPEFQACVREPDEEEHRSREIGRVIRRHTGKRFRSRAVSGN